MNRPTRKNQSSVSGLFRITWAATPARAASKPRTNGFTPPTGIAWFWMSIITARGGRTQKSCLRRRTQKRSRLVWDRAPNFWKTAMKKSETSCRSPHMAIFICPAHRSGLLPPANSSRSKSTTGPIPTNNGQSKNGRNRITLMPHCPGWCCWLTNCRTQSGKSPYRVSSTNSI